MNILEYLEDIEEVIQLSIKIDGKKIKFHIKNLSQEDAEISSVKQAKLLPIYEKQTKGKTLNNDEMKILLSYQSDVAYDLLCDCDGSPLYSTKEEMKKKIPSRIFKAMSESISKHNDMESAEKN